MTDQKTCVVTGLQLVDLPDTYFDFLGMECARLRFELDDAVDNAVDAGYTRFISGIECGSDNWAQWAVEEANWDREELSFERVFDLEKKIEEASMLIAIYDGRKAGLIAKLIQRAKQLKLEIVVILPNDSQSWRFPL